jgi:hypothetical protein
MVPKIDLKSAEYLYAITDARYGKGSVILTSCIQKDCL